MKRTRGDAAPPPWGSAALAVTGTAVPGGRARLLKDLRRLIDHVVREIGRPVHVSFLVTGDGPMRDLNRRSLAHDWPTDVLSFPIAKRPVLEGEVALSADTARREAALRGHPAYHELLLYAVHGVLHLLGHDDHEPSERRRMRRAERAALAALGVKPVFRWRRRRT